MKWKPGWLMPGTTINASDRKYIVDHNGCWRVLEYKNEHWISKKLKRANV